MEIQSDRTMTQQNTPDGTAPIVYAGADISKDTLDAHLTAWGQSRPFPNSPEGAAALLAALPPGTHVLCEATGGYERTLLAACWGAGVPVSLLNPARVRSLAEAAGQLAKTDAIDAAVITLFGEKFDPDPTPAPSGAQEELVAAFRHRERLVRLLAQLRGSRDRENDPYVLGSLADTIDLIDRQVGEIDGRIARIIGSDPGFSSLFERMTAVCGVGPVCASAVLAEMPEIGTVSDRRASSLAGLAPFPKESGRRRGRRIIRGGRSRLRRALYMPAMAARNHNPILREFYDRLVEKGKPHHVAITAVMRKLLCLLNRIAADPEFALAQTAKTTPVA